MQSEAEVYFYDHLTGILIEDEILEEINYGKNKIR